LPKSQAFRSSLWGLNRARLLTAAIVLAVGALLRLTEAFPYSFGTFAIAVIGGAASCLVLPTADRFGVRIERVAWFQVGLDALLITGIVTASGGPQSVFIPLYVLLVVGACFVLSRAGGVIVAAMASGRREIMIGAHRDGVFGPVVAVGDGGKYVEIFRDTALLLPPFSKDDAREALGKLQIAPLFAGVRGEPPM